MTKARSIVLGLLTATALVAVACSDLPSGPAAHVSRPAASLLGSGDTSQVQVVERLSPLSQSEIVTTTITPAGGTILLPEAGLTVTVPPGAVTRDTTIVVEAPAGNLVGYHFYPQGLVFNAPLIAVQDLAGTNAAVSGPIASSLVAAYFQGTLAPQVTALQILPLNLSGTLGTFEIHHFSGYVIGTS